MSVTLTIEDSLDLSRGDVLAIGRPHVATTFDADVVWMDERPLDPSRAYRVKHTTRTTVAEVSARLALNEIGSVTVSTSRPLVFDPYTDNRHTGSFVLIDASSNFTAGAGMITGPAKTTVGTRRWRSHAERLASVARHARSDADAADAVLRALDEILS
jgi:sulfate adenylyltransferase subunit 1